MKRDMDLIRELLLEIEEFEGKPSSSMLTGRRNEHDEYFVSEHLRLLLDAELINGVVHQALKGPFAVLGISITWKGYDFLDSVRDPVVWQKTKEAAKATGGLSLDLLKALAKGLVRKKIEDHTGIELDI